MQQDFHLLPFVVIVGSTDKKENFGPNTNKQWEDLSKAGFSG